MNKTTKITAVFAIAIFFLTSAAGGQEQSPDKKYLGHDVTEFIKYQNVIHGAITCFNHDCTLHPLRVEICNPTTIGLNVNLGKIEPQIITKYTNQGIIRPIGSISIPSKRTSILQLYEPCEKEIYDTNTSSTRTTTQRCPINHTDQITIIEQQPLIGELQFQPNTCYNLSIPFRPTNIPAELTKIEWQLNMTQYPNLSLHPFFNTHNYSTSFDNNTEIDGNSAGFNATGDRNSTGQLIANWTGPIKVGQFTNLTSRTRSLDGYETLASSSYTGGGCENQGGCAYDNSCNAADDSTTWSGSNLGKDWWCINFTKRTTILYAEIHEDRNDINIISANYFVTDIRPNATTPFNSSQMIKQQNSAETNEVGCTADAYTPIIPARILSGYLFCANISTMEGGANARIGEAEIWSANFTKNSRMKSTQIAIGSTIGEFQIAANQTLNNGIIGYNISCDGGTTFKSVNHTGLGLTHQCTTNGNTLLYEITLEANETTNTLTPTIDRLDIEVFPASGTATENEARTAIENGIKDNFPAAAISTDQQIFIKYHNDTQKYSTTDKAFTNSNKRWILNYLTGSDTTNAMSNLGTNVYAWENQSLTTTQIRQQVRDLVNMTK